MLTDMLNYCKNMDENHILVIYNGPLWAEVVESLADTLQKRLIFDELPLSVSQAVFSVFVEQMNNMLMYSAENEVFRKTNEGPVETPKGTSILGSVGKAYFIQTGNVMKNSSVELVKTQIEYLNTLDKAELRKYYKEQIKLENTNSESKGAGLGLIEIARRASSKIEYSFTSYGEGLTFFTMYVVIGGGN